jgi:hypothetical protein
MKRGRNIDKSHDVFIAMKRAQDMNMRGKARAVNVYFR